MIIRRGKRPWFLSIIVISLNYYQSWQLIDWLSITIAPVHVWVTKKMLNESKNIDIEIKNCCFWHGRCLSGGSSAGRVPALLITRPWHRSFETSHGLINYGGLFWRQSRFIPTRLLVFVFCVIGIRVTCEWTILPYDMKYRFFARLPCFAINLITALWGFSGRTYYEPRVSLVNSGTVGMNWNKTWAEFFLRIRVHFVKYTNFEWVGWFRFVVFNYSGGLPN